MEFLRFFQDGLRGAKNGKKTQRSRDGIEENFQKQSQMLNSFPNVPCCLLAVSCHSPYFALLRFITLFATSLYILETLHWTLNVTQIWKETQKCFSLLQTPPLTIEYHSLFLLIFFCPTSWSPSPSRSCAHHYILDQKFQPTALKFQRHVQVLRPSIFFAAAKARSGPAAHTALFGSKTIHSR